jgi:cell division protein FtsQ
MKRVIQISLFVLFSLAVAGLMGFVYIENGKQPVKGVVIRIDRDTEEGFLSEEKIKILIEQNDSILFRQVNEVNTQKIEDLVNQNVYVETADSYLNMDKNVVVNISEKIPVLRVYSKKGKGFYIDKKGRLIPLSQNYTPRVLVANGYINATFEKENTSIFDTIYKTTPLADLFELSNLITANSFINAQISQIYINSKGEYDLIPELGDHLIQLGTIENAKEKLEKLEIWYKKAIVREGWDQYSVVNLKYKDQVVCTKK